MRGCACVCLRVSMHECLFVVCAYLNDCVLGCLHACLCVVCVCVNVAVCV